MRMSLVFNLSGVLSGDPVYDLFSDVGVPRYHAAKRHEDDHNNGDYDYH